LIHLNPFGPFSFSLVLAGLMSLGTKKSLAANAYDIVMT
jgi:hypothetical protein